MRPLPPLIPLLLSVCCAVDEPESPPTSFDPPPAVQSILTHESNELLLWGDAHGQGQLQANTVQTGDDCRAVIQYHLGAVTSQDEDVVSVTKNSPSTLVLLPLKQGQAKVRLQGEITGVTLPPDLSADIRTRCLTTTGTLTHIEHTITLSVEEITSFKWDKPTLELLSHSQFTIPYTLGTPSGQDATRALNAWRTRPLRVGDILVPSPKESPNVVGFDTGSITITTPESLVPKRHTYVSVLGDELGVQIHPLAEVTKWEASWVSPILEDDVPKILHQGQPVEQLPGGEVALLFLTSVTLESGVALDRFDALALEVKSRTPKACTIVDLLANFTQGPSPLYDPTWAPRSGQAAPNPQVTQSRFGVKFLAAGMCAVEVTWDGISAKEVAFDYHPEAKP